MTQDFPHQLKQSTLWQRVFRTRAEDVLPHDITHERIYIVPSKRGCAFLFTVLVMLIASVNYALSLGYALSFLLTGLFAASLLHTYKNIAGLTVQDIELQDAFAGTSGQIDLSLNNTQQRARHGIRISSAQTTTPLIHPEASTSKSITINTPALNRGIYKPGRLTLQSDWPLGLWTCWTYLHVDHKAFVYPTAESDPPPLPTLGGPEAKDRLKPATTGDVNGLREYQPGDSMGSIAWKSSARTNGLLSRTFESESASTNTILSLEHTGLAEQEAQLSRLCAWVLLAETQQTDYAVQLKTLSIPQGRGRQHRARALEALSIYGHSAESSNTNAQ